MYTIEQTYGIANAQGAVWQNHNIESLTGVQLYSLFRRLFITLSNTQLAQPVTINIVDYQAVLSYDTRTVLEIFTDWTDVTPLIGVTVPSFVSKKAVFTDVMRAGYTVHKSIPGAHYTSSQDDGLKTEMQITRVGTDMNLLAKYCLVTANGYFYKIEADQFTAYIPEAGKTLLKTRFNHVGLFSFEKIGEIKTQAIDPSDILPHTIGKTLYDAVNVPLPTESITNKTLLLVVAGHLHFLSDGVFSIVSNTRAVIRPGAIPLLERYQESKDKIDWSTIVDMENNTFVNSAMMKSDEGVRALLMHPQTFWLIVDTPNIAKSRLPIRSLPLPGQFISPIEPKDLLVAGSGYVLEYWLAYEAGEWAVNCSGVRPGRAVSGTVGRNELAINAAMTNTPYQTSNNIQAHFLVVTADQITE